MYHTVSLVHTTPDAEQLIAYMARVSNPNNQDNPESERLIRYLIKHKHWSPFEMVNMCVQIETTRSVAAQILRHRSFHSKNFHKDTLKWRNLRLSRNLDAKIQRIDRIVLMI